VNRGIGRQSNAGTNNDGPRLQAPSSHIVRGWTEGIQGVGDSVMYRAYRWWRVRGALLVCDLDVMTGLSRKDNLDCKCGGGEGGGVAEESWVTRIATGLAWNVLMTAD